MRDIKYYSVTQPKPKPLRFKIIEVNEPMPLTFMQTYVKHLYRAFTLIKAGVLKKDS